MTLLVISDLIQYARQNIIQSDIDAVINALESDFLTQGPTVPRFENAVAERVSASYAVATNSATSSLHLACLALGLGPGDLLWTVPNSFVASANCGRLCGADVDFVDINPTSYCMDVEALELKLKKSECSGSIPKVIVVVHYSGRSADMKSIRKIADRYEISVIEDAAHAIGGSYLGKPIGCCEFSDITVFSFHPVKVMTTGEGGMAITNDSEIAARISRTRTHGITRNPDEMENNNPLPWEFEQHNLGFNYRMTELQAALGLSQLERLDSFVARRRQIAEQYNEKLLDLPLIVPNIEWLNESAWHLYPVLVDSENMTKSELYYSLLDKGIKSNVHFIPIHTHPYYQKMGFRPGDYPVSEWFYSSELSLPMYFELSNSDQQQVIDALSTILGSKD